MSTSPTWQPHFRQTSAMESYPPLAPSSKSRTHAAAGCNRVSLSRPHRYTAVVMTTSGALASTPTCCGECAWLCRLQCVDADVRTHTHRQCTRAQAIDTSPGTILPPVLSVNTSNVASTLGVTVADIPTAVAPPAVVAEVVVVSEGSASSPQVEHYLSQLFAFAIHHASLARCKWAWA